MIHDGYTQHGAFDSVRISYRPATHAERVEFTRGHQTHETIRAFIKRHLLWHDMGVCFPEKTEEALFLICFGVIGPEKGSDWEPNWETRDARNLFNGVVLELTYPQFANRDCTECKKWWFNDDTGRISERGGKPMLRPLDVVTLCQTNAGCPKGTPENQKGLSEKNRCAWKHYQECRAVGEFPDDPIVRRNAVIIQKAIREAKRGR